MPHTLVGEPAATSPGYVRKASRPASRYLSRSHERAPLPRGTVSRRGRGRASVDLPRAAFAGAARRRAPDRCFAAGKAAGSMAEVAERLRLSRHARTGRRAGSIGLAVTRHGYARPTRVLPVIEAGHPVPDQASLDGAARAPRARRRRAREGDLVLVLMSGGASAELDLRRRPASTLAEKQAVTRALLKSGAAIGEMNTAAQASLPHQGRASRGARLPGPSREPRNLRRAGR